IISYVATDNTEGGRIAARRMGEILGGKGKVGIMGFMPGSASTMEREHGFQDEIRQRFPGIDIIGLQFGMADRAKAMAATENMLAAHPDLAGVFADNESSSAGALQALKSRGASGVKLVAFDTSDQLIASLRDGSIDSLVAQNPFRMGYESARAIGLKLGGGAPAAKVDSGVSLIRRGGVGGGGGQKMLFPGIYKSLRGGSWVLPGGGVL